MEEITLLSLIHTAFLGELRYLNPLQVFGIGDRFDSTITDLELTVDLNNQQKKQVVHDREANRTDPICQNLSNKITYALNLLSFREPYVLVQFWSARTVGKRQLLTTLDQPFGVGVIDDRLRSYRRDSESYSFIVDKDHEEEDQSPAARVFRHELPEWTSDLNSYTSKQFSQQACAIRCGLHGYLGLPVFDSDTGTCVGVVEILTASKYTSYAYEVQQIYNALKTEHLRTHQAFDFPALNVPNERRQNVFDKIHAILKMACDNHNVPLAQTWVVSQHTSFVSHEKVIKNSCSSFDTRCVGKVCMSRSGLPFYVQEMRMWPFFKASRERHLDRSRGLVGKALSTRGSCFCGDVTKLTEDEYPLVHYARMNELTGCFAIFLHNIETNEEYVLEFYLPTDIKESSQVCHLVQTLKQNIPVGSGLELGDSSRIHIVEPPTEEVDMPLSTDLGTIQIASGTTTNNNQVETVTSDSESMPKTDSASVSNPCPYKEIYLADIITNTESVTRDDFIDDIIRLSSLMRVRENEKSMSNNVSDTREKSNSSKKGRKRKIDSLTMEEVVKHFGKTMDQAANSLNVSRSTLKRFCREHDMPSWPLTKNIKTTIHNTDLEPSGNAQIKQNLLPHSNKRFRLSFVVILIVRVKRWSCLIKSHGFSGKWWSCGKHNYLPSGLNFIYLTTILIVRLKRWRNKISKKNAKLVYTMNIMNNAYSRVAESSLVHAFPKKTVARISDTKMVTVKATYKDDMIKFQFPTSSDLLKLKNEVAQRIKLEKRRICLKYKDEDNDLISLASDDDLKFLLDLTANNTTIRLLIADYF